jgi:hypothetical protein
MKFGRGGLVGCDVMGLRLRLQEAKAIKVVFAR